MPDGREEVATLIVRLGELAEKRDGQAIEALAVIARLSEQFQKSGPGDKREIGRALARLFDTRKPAQKKDQPGDPLQLAAAEALGGMGPQSVPALIAAIGQKKLRDDLELQRQLMLALGRTCDKKGIEPLLDNLHNKDDVLIAAAGEALGSYERADQATRKRVFEEVLKTLVAVKSSVDHAEHEQGTAETPQPSPQGAAFADRYETIRAPLLGALARLSKHQETEPEAWQRWWNKNKKADWDVAKG